MKKNPNKTICELKVNAHTDREAVVAALANSGYFVTVEEREKLYELSGDFFVIVKEGDKK